MEGEANTGVDDDLGNQEPCPSPSGTWLEYILSRFILSINSRSVPVGVGIMRDVGV